MLERRPAWLRDNTESVLREAAPYRRLSPEAKLELVASACRTAAILLDASPNREKALAYVDPLPASTVTAIERLMRHYRAARQNDP